MWPRKNRVERSLGSRHKGHDQNGRVTPARNQRGHICRPHGAQPLPEKAAEAIADESIEGRRWAEVDALLAAPDQHTWSGRRDHAFILLAVQTGLRLSEMTGDVSDR